MTKNLYVCIGDGDNIGDVIELHLLSGNLEIAGKFSFQVKCAIEKIVKNAQIEMNATVIYAAGDDICFMFFEQGNYLKHINEYANQFYLLTGNTISFGIGKNSVEALISLRKAKVLGKNRIIVSNTWGFNHANNFIYFCYNQ